MKEPKSVKTRKSYDAELKQGKSEIGTAPRYTFFLTIIPIMVLLTRWDKGLPDRRWFPRISLGYVLICRSVSDPITWNFAR